MRVIIQSTAVLSSVGPTYPLTGHAAGSEHAVSGHMSGHKRWVRRQSAKQLPRTIQRPASRDKVTQGELLQAMWWRRTWRSSLVMTA